MSKTINDGGPAFPDPRAHSMTTGTEAKGMSLRAYFAARAMQGLISHHQGLSTIAQRADAEELPMVNVAARTAVGLADALIAELAKNPKD